MVARRHPVGRGALLGGEHGHGGEPAPGRRVAPHDLPVARHLECGRAAPVLHAVRVCAHHEVAVRPLVDSAEVRELQLRRVGAFEAPHGPVVGRVLRDRAEVRDERVAVRAAERLERERRRGLLPDELPGGVVLAHDVRAGAAHEVRAGSRLLHHAVVVVRARHLAVDPPGIALEARHDLLAAELQLGDVVGGVLGDDHRARVGDPEPVRAVALRGAVEELRLPGRDVRDPHVAVRPVNLVAAPDRAVDVPAAVLAPRHPAVRREQPDAPAAARDQRLGRTPLEASSAKVQSGGLRTDRTRERDRRQDSRRCLHLHFVVLLCLLTPRIIQQPSFWCQWMHACSSCAARPKKRHCAPCEPLVS